MLCCMFPAGVIDDRGKFISITPEELDSVAQFIRQRGRVSITELAQASNRLINLMPESRSAAWWTPEWHFSWDCRRRITTQICVKFSVNCWWKAHTGCWSVDYCLVPADAVICWTVTSLLSSLYSPVSCYYSNGSTVTTVYNKTINMTNSNLALWKK